MTGQAEHGGSSSSSSPPSAKRWLVWGAGLLATVLIAVIAYWLEPGFLQPLWERAGIFVPLATVLGLFLYTGCPHKHTKLPELDPIVVAYMSVVVVLESVQRVFDAIDQPQQDDDAALVAVVLGVAGLKALQTSFRLANESHKKPSQRHQG